MALAAASPIGGAAVYGAAMATGLPHGPCTPGTVVGPKFPPQEQPACGGPNVVPVWYVPVPVDSQPPRAASSSITPAVRFMVLPCPLVEPPGVSPDRPPPADPVRQR